MSLFGGTVVGKAVVELLGDSAQFRAEMEGAAKRFEGLGRRMETMGRQMTTALTLPLAGAATAITRTSARFETSMSKIVGLVGVASEQVDQWGRDIIEMAPRLGKAPQELADGLFFVTSAGFRGAEAMEVLEAAAKASAAGMGDVATIADLVTSAVNAYGSDVLSAAKATDTLTAAVREGKLEPAELAGSMGQVLPVASAMGIGFDEVGAAMASMSRTGTNAATAATQLRQIMVSLMKPTQQAEDALEGMGLSARKLREQIREKGLLSVLQTLAEQFEGNDEAAAQVFGNIRALAGITDLMGANAAGTAAIFGELEDATGALDHAFATAAETAQFKMNAAMAEISGSMIQLGGTVMPMVASAVSALASAVGKLGDVFAKMPRPLQQVTVGMAALVAVAGPVLWIFGRLLQMAPLIVAAFVKMGGAIIAVKASLLTIVAPIALVAAAAYVMWKNWDVMRIQFVLAWTWIKTSTLDAVGAILGALEKLFGWMPVIGTRLRTMRQEFDAFFEETLAKSGRAIAEMEMQLAGMGNVPADMARTLADAKRMIDEVLGDAGGGTGGASGAIIEATEQTRNFTKAMEELRETLLDRSFAAGIERVFRVATEHALDGVEAMRTMSAEAVTLSKGAQESIAAWADGIADSTEGSLSALDTLGHRMTFVAGQGADAFADFALGSSDAISRFVRDALRQLARLLARMALVRALSAAFPGVGSALGGFGGMFARGGTLRPYEWGVVGERGAEIIQAGARAMTITPMAAVDSTLAAGAPNMAGAVLAALGPPPEALSPEMAATHRWYRRLIGAMRDDYLDRGGAF